MKAALLVIPLLILVSVPVHARTVYCTEKNWHTAIDYYKKQEQRSDQNVGTLNQQVESYNRQQFLQDHYNAQQLTSAWRNGNDELQRMLDTQASLYFEEVDRLNTLKKDLLSTQEKIDKAETLWQKLADYCYDEGSYDHYKAGRNNMRNVIKLKQQGSEMLDKVDRMRLKYLKDIGLINRSKQLVEEAELHPVATEDKPAP